MKKKYTIELSGDHAENIARMAPCLNKRQQEDVYNVLYGMMVMATKDSDRKSK